MYYIRKEFIHFWTISEYCLFLLNEIKSHAYEHRKNYVYSAGILNLLWESWNKFWRTLWLAYMIGGIDMDKNKILPLYPQVDEYQAIYRVLYLLGKKNTPAGKIVASYQEPRWGDINIMHKLSQTLRNPGPGNKILNAFSVLGNSPKHLQIVRNAAIHLDRDGITKVKYIASCYRISISKIKYPTDLLFSQDLATGKIVFRNWIDELVAFLQLI